MREVKFLLFISQRLRTSKGNDGSSSSILNIAIIGITISIVIMILSISIVLGFKQEISNKIYNLEPHIKICNAAIYTSNIGSDDYTVNIDTITSIIDTTAYNIKSHELIAERPAVLKTNDDFYGVIYKGYTPKHDWEYLNNILISGRLPNVTDSINEIIISQQIANKLHLDINQSIYTYFIDDNIKARRNKIVGIYNSDFEEYDKLSVIGSIALIQQINGWKESEGSYISININDQSNIDQSNIDIYSAIMESNYANNNYQYLYDVSSTHELNSPYFAWLSLLDMNVIVILILMSIVSAFTMISGLLILVLERVNMIGILKALGGTNSTIRNIFILLTQKLIIKSLIIGNVIGLSLAYIQSEFKILTLNPDNYYMSFVPIEINLGYILILNLSVIALAYITLLAPSYIVASIKPSKAIKFE